MISFSKFFLPVLWILLSGAVLQGQPTGTFTDGRDGHTYSWVRIGNQTWMAGNLAYLPWVSRVGDGQFEGKCYYVYGYDGTDLSSARQSTNYTACGVLYNWLAAREGCPDGWHLPTDQEWKELEEFLGMKMDNSNRGWRMEGGVGRKLMSVDGWLAGGGNDESGFRALPGGCRGYGGFESLGYCGYFWTATAAGGDNGWRRGLCGEKAGVCREEDRRYFGISVRCVRDDQD